MAIVTKAASTLTLLALMVLTPALAHAQEERLRVSFTPAVATVGGDAELALAGTLGYRFSEHFWFEGDVTWIDAAAGGFRDGNQLALGGLADTLTRSGGIFDSWRRSGRRILPGFGDLPESIRQFAVTTGGSTLVATLGVRYELPAQTARFRPYVSGGLGINNTEQEFDIERLVSDVDLEDSFSHTGYAFNAGAGASVRLVSSLWADVDAKYFRLSRERNVMRLGGGVSFRF
jgi:opacity protein-like surface antigen